MDVQEWQVDLSCKTGTTKIRHTTLYNVVLIVSTRLDLHTDEYSRRSIATLTLKKIKITSTAHHQFVNTGQFLVGNRPTISKLLEPPWRLYRRRFRRQWIDRSIMERGEPVSGIPLFARYFRTPAITDHTVKWISTFSIGFWLKLGLAILPGGRQHNLQQRRQEKGLAVGDTFGHGRPVQLNAKRQSVGGRVKSIARATTTSPAPTRFLRSGF